MKTTYTEEIVLQGGVSPISNILSRKDLPDFCKTQFLLSPTVYESLEKTLFHQMGSRQNTIYGKIPGMNISIAISYDKDIELYKIDWISTFASLTIYNAENQSISKKCLYKA